MTQVERIVNIIKESMKRIYLNKNERLRMKGRIDRRGDIGDLPIAASCGRQREYQEYMIKYGYQPFKKGSEFVW